MQRRTAAHAARRNMPLAVCSDRVHSPLMPDHTFDDETIATLARAFDRAWERFYQPGLSDDEVATARSELAKQIVALAHGGERDENRLNSGGLIYLRGLRQAKRAELENWLAKRIIKSPSRRSLRSGPTSDR